MEQKKTKNCPACGRKTYKFNHFRGNWECVNPGCGYINKSIQRKIT